MEGEKGIEYSATADVVIAARETCHALGLPHVVRIREAYGTVEEEEIHVQDRDF